MRRPALFLDRDGVVNEDSDFVHLRDDFVFSDGIFDLVRAALDLGFAPVIVTNQSGIARGLFTEEAFHDLNRWMLSVFEQRGAPVAKVYHCPYHPEAAVAAYRHADHPWRKPAPGMLLAARDELALDLSRSAMIGDRWSDVAAGHAAGLPFLALVGDRADREGAAADPPPADRLADIREAVGWLQAKAGRD